MQWYWTVLGAIAFVGVLVLIGSRTSKREFQIVLLAILCGLILAIPFLASPHNYVVAVFVVADLVIIVGPLLGPWRAHDRGTHIRVKRRLLRPGAHARRWAPRRTLRRRAERTRAGLTDARPGRCSPALRAPTPSMPAPMEVRRTVPL